MEYTTTLKDLRMADSMRMFLEGIAVSSKVAQYLLHTGMFTDYGDFLAIRYKDGIPMISFCPKGKAQEFNENGNYCRKNRQEGTPARVAQRLIKANTFTNQDYEIFSNLFTGKLITNIEFHVGERTKDFQFAYLEDNYVFTKTGSLWNSCMRYERCQDYVAIYEKFGAKILYATISGKVAARAILWTLDDGDLLLDRIYGYNDSIKYAMLQYAKNELKIAYYKEYDTYDSPTQFIHILNTGVEVACTHSFAMRVGDVVAYDTDVPYMDTFKYFSDEWLYNDQSDIDNGRERYEMCSTDGTLETSYRCANCGEWIDEEDVCWVGDHLLCRCCSVYDDYAEEWIDRNDAVDALNDSGNMITTHVSNTIELSDGSYALQDAVVYDDYCEEYILRGDAAEYTTISGGMVFNLTTHQDNLRSRDFVLIDDEYYEISTCEGQLIEEIDDEWYRIDSEDWKEAKVSQEIKINDINKEEVA